MPHRYDSCHAQRVGESVPPLDIKIVENQEVNLSNTTPPTSQPIPQTPQVKLHHPPPSDPTGDNFQQKIQEQGCRRIISPEVESSSSPRSRAFDVVSSQLAELVLFHPIPEEVRLREAPSLDVASVVLIYPQPDPALSFGVAKP